MEWEEVCEGKDGVGREEEAGKANGAVQCSLDIHLGEVFLIASLSFVIQKRGMEVAGNVGLEVHSTCRGAGIIKNWLMSDPSHQISRSNVHMKPWQIAPATN